MFERDFSCTGIICLESKKGFAMKLCANKQQAIELTEPEENSDESI